MKQQEEWWHSFFDDVFASVVLERSSEECERTLAFLTEVLHLKEGDHVFDQCCGTGEVSHILADAGYKTYGVDVIASYIDIAQQKVHAHSEFICSDAIDYKTPVLCDAAINWYTSFGYYKDDAENLQILKKLSESVKLDGYIALDLTNASASYREAKNIRYYKKETALGLVEIERRYFFDLERGVRGSVWRYQLPSGQIIEKHGESRLYVPAELSAMLHKAGFQVRAFYGDLNFGALELDSERCICVAQKVS